jgi:TRAP-type C4-dicarboxylate transport system permease small subunit
MAENTPATGGLVRLVRALNVLSTVTLFLAASGLVLMTALVAWQVFSRYVLDDSPSWTEAASLLVMPWFIFLGAAVGVRENFHMGFDVLLYVLPTSAKVWLRSISDFAVLSFGIGMVVYGGQLIVQTWPSPIPVLQLPGGVAYMPVTAGGVLIAIFAVERLVLRFAGMEVEHDPSLDDATLSEV